MPRPAAWATNAVGAEHILLRASAPDGPGSAACSAGSGSIRREVRARLATAERRPRSGARRAEELGRTPPHAEAADRDRLAEAREAGTRLTRGATAARRALLRAARGRWRRILADAGITAGAQVRGATCRASGPHRGAGPGGRARASLPEAGPPTRPLAAQSWRPSCSSPSCRSAWCWLRAARSGHLGLRHRLSGRAAARRVTWARRPSTSPTGPAPRSAACSTPPSATRPS